MKIPCAICKQLFTPLRGRGTCDKCIKETTEAYCRKYALPSNIQGGKVDNKSAVV